MSKARTQKKLVNGIKEDVVIEEDYRRQLLNVAKGMGCEQDLKQIFNKYDAALKKCGNEKEKKAIQILGISDISRLLDGEYFGVGNGITIDGVTAILSKDKEKK